MDSRRQVLETYFDAFRRSDHAAVLGCLTDDVVWNVHGVRTTHGKAEFDTEIENPDFEGSPVLREDRIVSEGDVTIVTGTGRGTHRQSGPFAFAFATASTFRGDLIAQVDSYVAPVAS